jgi:SAM-dependent methyltransferase
MTARDAFRYINELDAATLDGFIERLEFRGRDPVFTRLRDNYLGRLRLDAADTVLEIGCGTGVIARALARRADFTGRVVACDQSPAFLAAGERFARDEGVTDRLAFEQADAHALPYPTASFDRAIAHTLISHVADPAAVLREAARVTRPDGLIVFFDGDYASLTFGYPDAALGTAVEQAIIGSIVNNPRIMRDLPRLLPAAGLALVEASAYTYAEVGTGRFFAGLATAYAPLVTRANLLPAAQLEEWLAYQQRTASEGGFFAACNYYTYLSRPMTLASSGI